VVRALRGLRETLAAGVGADQILAAVDLLAAEAAMAEILAAVEVELGAEARAEMAAGLAAELAVKAVAEPAATAVAPVAAPGGREAEPAVTEAALAVELEAALEAQAGAGAVPEAGPEAVPEARAVPEVVDLPPEPVIVMRHFNINTGKVRAPMETDQQRQERTGLSSLEISDRESAAVQKTRNRVTLESMLEKIVATEYIHPKSIPHLTICVLVTENGYALVGKSAPADPENFDEELGHKFAKEDAFRQMWGLEAYLMRERMKL
jgi:hypothetical protein